MKRGFKGASSGASRGLEGELQGLRSLQFSVLVSLTIESRERKRDLFWRNRVLPMSSSNPPKKRTEAALKRGFLVANLCDGTSEI